MLIKGTNEHLILSAPESMSVALITVTVGSFFESEHTVGTGVLRLQSLVFWRCAICLQCNVSHYRNGGAFP